MRTAAVRRHDQRHDDRQRRHAIYSSGGIVSGTTTINGGILELASGTAASAGTIDLAGTGGTLKIDGTTIPSTAISGFTPGDTIDLANIAYDSGGSINLSGGNVLHLVESSTSYDINLDPSQSFSGECFGFTSDGSGGTVITVAHCRQVVISSGTTSVSTSDPTLYIVEGSGTLDVVNGGTVTSATISAGGVISVTSGGATSDTTVSSGGVEVLTSGGFDISATVQNGGTTIVSGDGTLDISSASTVLDGAVFSSGSILDLIGVSGTPPTSGYPDLLDGTILKVNSNSIIEISSGGQFGGTLDARLVSGGVLEILSSGAASSITISSGSIEYVSSGGVNGAATISNGGQLIISAGGTDSGSVISSGGVEIVSSGGTAHDHSGVEQRHAGRARHDHEQRHRL